MSVAHSTFVIERSYPVPAARVWGAWADPALKSRWFATPDDWENGAYALDFRIGGQETSQGGPPGGEIHYYKATIMDIVPEQRIVYAYDLLLGERRISASLATVELRPEGDGTRQVFTEQGAFFEGEGHRRVVLRERRRLCHDPSDVRPRRGPVGRGAALRRPWHGDGRRWAGRSAAQGACP